MLRLRILEIVELDAKHEGEIGRQRKTYKPL